MKKISVVRTIGKMGRLTLPSKFREELGMETGTVVVVELSDHKLVVQKEAAGCALCGGNEGLLRIRDRWVCRDCLGEIHQREKEHD